MRIFPLWAYKMPFGQKLRLLIMKFFNLLRLVIDAAVSRHRAASYSINRATGTFWKVGLFHILIRGGWRLRSLDKLVSTKIFDIPWSLIWRQRQKVPGQFEV